MRNGISPRITALPSVMLITFHGKTKEKIEKLLELYGEVEILEVDLMAEGMSTSALELTFENDSTKTLILQLSEMDLTIYRIEIISSIFKTEEGVGIKSTYNDLQINYDFEGVCWEDGGEPLVIVEEINMSFVIEQGDWWQMGEAVGDISRNTEIVKIFTW